MAFDLGGFLGGLLGGLLTLFGVVETLKYYRKKDEEKLKKEMRQKKEELARLKPLFKVEIAELENPDFDLVFINIEDVEVGSGIFIKYNKELASIELPYMEFRFTNVGRSRVRFFDVATNLKTSTALIPWRMREFYLKNGLYRVSDIYDRAIDIGESVTLRVHHSKTGYIVRDLGGAALSIYFEDEHGHYWKQPFFYENCNLYDPVQMDYQRYISEITERDVFDSFRHPEKW